MLKLIKNYSTSINNTKLNNPIEINNKNLIAMLSLNKSKNYLTGQEILNHLIGVTFELPISFEGLIKSELFINNILNNESGELILYVFFVTRDTIEKEVEFITETIEEKTLTIGIVKISFSDLVFDTDFKSCFLGMYNEESDSLVHKPSYLKTLFIFEDFSWLELVKEFKKYKIGLSGVVNTRRHLLYKLEYKLSLYLNAMGISLNHINKFYHQNIKKPDSRKGSHYNLELKKDDSKIGENHPIYFPMIERLVQNNNRNNVINNNYQNYNNYQSQIESKEEIKQIKKNTKNKEIIGFSLKPQKREFSTSSSFNLQLLKGETVTHIRNIDKNKNPTKKVNSSNKIEDKTIESKTLSILESVKNIENKEKTSYLNDIFKEISNPNVDLHSIQLKLEDGYIDLIKNKLNEDNIMSFQLSKCINQAYKALTIFLNNKRKYKTEFPILKQFFEDKNLVLLAFGIITTYYSKISATNLIDRVGSEILWYICKKLRKEKNKLAVDLKGNNIPFIDFKKKFEWTEKLNIQLGYIFVSIFEEIEVLSVDFRERENGEMQNYYVVNKDYIKHIIDNMLILPPSLPMISKPNLWDKNNFGGFLTNQTEQQDLVSGSISNNSHIVQNKESLYQAINFVNLQKFGINTELLNYLENDGKFLLDNEDETLDKENDFSTKLQIIFTLQLAKLYSNIPFYLNTSADWRGRIYTKSFFLSYQGSDLSNAIIQFWEGKSLTSQGLDFLYITGANAYDENGISKKSYDDRIKWVINNYEKILSMVPEFILKADSRYQFVVFCLNMRRIHIDNNSLIFTPIFLDATCSGIQHLAGLMRDLELASWVNLVKQEPSDSVGDLYSFIVEPINKELNRIGQTNEEYKHFTKIKLNRKLIKWNIMTIVYNITVYGGSRQLQGRLEKVTHEISQDNQIIINNQQSVELIAVKLENIFESTDENILTSKKGKTKVKIKETFYKAPADNTKGYVLLSKKDLFEIARVIHDQVFISFPSLKLIYEYLINITKLLTKLGIPVSWFTPSGLKIKQLYNKSDVERCSFRMGEKHRTVVYRKTNKNKVNTLKQVQAIIPNIIHSLDASHLINILNTIDKNHKINVITVHDCFGTHPNDMGLLTQIVKKEFILLYLKENFLEKFHQKILESIRDNNYEVVKEKGRNKLSKEVVLFNNEKFNIPDLPKLGELDLNQIIDSQHMIT